MMNITRYTFSIALLLSSAVSTVSAHTATCSHSCTQDSSDSKKTDVTAPEETTKKTTKTAEVTEPVAPTVETAPASTTKTAAAQVPATDAMSDAMAIEELIKEAGFSDDEIAEINKILKEGENATAEISIAVADTKKEVVAEAKAEIEATKQIVEVTKTTI